MQKNVCRPSTFTPSEAGKALLGLRGIVAISILIYHWKSRYPAFINAENLTPLFGIEIDWVHILQHTSFGIHWFFLLSGYHLAEKYQSSGLTGRTILTFWKSRVLRIFPALWALIFALILTTYLMRGNFDFFQWRIFIGNLLIWQTPLPGGVRPYSANLWTLPVEFSFYALLPILLLVRKKTPQWFLLLAALVISISWRQLLLTLHPGIDLGQHFFWEQSILGSIFIFVLGMYIRDICERLPKKSHNAGMIGLIIFFILWREYKINHMTDPSHLWFINLTWEMVRGIVSALMLAIIVSGTVKTYFLGAPFLRSLGKMSFGIYLWHFPILWLSPRIFHIPGATATGSVQLLIICLLLTLSIAALSYRYIEKPILKKWGHTNEPLNSGGASGRDHPCARF